MGAPTSPAVMRDALMAARRHISAGMVSFIETECVRGKQGLPLLESMDAEALPQLNDYRRLIRQIDDALGRRGKGVRRGRK